MNSLEQLSKTSIKFLLFLLFLLVIFPVFNKNIDVLNASGGVCFICSGIGWPGSPGWWFGCGLEYEGYTNCHLWVDENGNQHCEAYGQQCSIAIHF